MLSNISDQVIQTDVTFTSIGVNSAPTPPVHVTLQPGETQRLANVVGQQWGIRNGGRRADAHAAPPGRHLPDRQGRELRQLHPAKRFGQSMPAVTEPHAAGAGQSQYLVGLRQDAKYRTTFWLFNPGTTAGRCTTSSTAASTAR